MAVASLLLVSGCSQLTLLPVPADSELQLCLQQYQQLEASIAEYGGQDYQSSQIVGFAYLRSNRFWAAFADQTLSDEQLLQWLQGLQQLDLEARQAEIANLPKDRQPIGGISAYQQCSDLYLQHLQRDDKALARLRERVEVPDSYSALMRLLGIYPITSLVVENRIAKYQQQVKQRFAIPLSQLHSDLPLQRYQVAFNNNNVSLTRDNPLNIPYVEAEGLISLFQRHAPLWEVVTLDKYDRLGSPVWQQGDIEIDTHQPRSYRYTSYTRMAGMVLLQLNYVVWFPARPGDDIYAGSLDGITWRVTLDENGEPLLYDSIHNCGCYHKLYPTLRLHQRNETFGWREPPLIPQIAPYLAQGQRIVVRVASATHYIERIYADEVSGSKIALEDYWQLRSLPLANGERRSLFGEQGIIKQSVRSERWLLWPMGIASAGAMRQVGNHAIAFIGRRHFDDVDLLERLFTLEEPYDEQ